MYTYCYGSNTTVKEWVADYTTVKEWVAELYYSERMGVEFRHARLRMATVLEGL